MVEKPNIWLVGPADYLKPLAQSFWFDGFRAHISDPYATGQGATKASVQQMAENAGAALGRIDTLVFCDRLGPEPTADNEAEEVVRQTLAATNGLLHSVGCLVRTMKTGAVPGQVVVVCDTSAVAGRNGGMVRSTVGGALIGMSKSLAKELGRYRIAVNVICVGPIAGDESENALTPAEVLMFKATGTGKPATMEHLSNNIRHLASGEHWMNGQILHINDGLLM